MHAHWTDIELEEQWCLEDCERQTLLPGKSQGQRLAVAALLNFYQLAGRFPDNLREVPEAALKYLHKSFILDIGVNAASLYHLSSRTYERHRVEIRQFLGIRKADGSDQERAKHWLVKDIITGEQAVSELNAELTEWFRRHNRESISPKAQYQLIKNAIHDFEKRFFQGIAKALSPSSKKAIDHLLRPLDEDVVNQDTRFQMLSSDPGRPSLKTVFKEIEKLEAIEQLALPRDLFSNIPAKVLHAYRLRAGTESITELRKHPETVRYVLVTAFCYEKRAEIIDCLADLLIQLVHKIGVRAEKHVVRELLIDIRAVNGKPRLLYKLADAALSNPDGRVRDVLYSVVNEETLQNLVKEYQVKGPGYQRQIQTLVCNSYRGHYRRMVPNILGALEFHSNNAHHRPVIEALEVLKALRDSGKRFLGLKEMPITGIVPDEFRPLVVESDGKGDKRLNRIHYEICVLQALRERLRCKEIWIAGAKRYCNPDQGCTAGLLRKAQSLLRSP